MKLYYIAVALNLHERTACDHEHRKASGARRCVRRFARDSEMNQRMVRIFGYEQGGDSLDGPVYREEAN